MSKVYTPFSDQKSPKAIPFGHIPILYGLYKSTTPPPTSKFTQISCHCFNFVYFKHQVNHRHTNIWSAVSLSFKQLKVKQKHRSKCWNHMVVYLNSPSLPYINILGSQGANFYVSCSILPTSWIKPRAGVTKDSKCLTPHVTSSCPKQFRWSAREQTKSVVQAIPCLLSRPTCVKLYTLFRTREDKNHTQSHSVKWHIPIWAFKWSIPNRGKENCYASKCSWNSTRAHSYNGL